MSRLVAREIDHAPDDTTPAGAAAGHGWTTAIAGNLDPKLAVTILLVTYNHEKYITKALESVVMQRFAFPVEIVIADDSSTDSTRQIITGFFEKHPVGPVRFLDHARNRGVTRNYQRSFYCLTTKYVAVLEGDDYWTDPDKIRKQVEFLESNAACVGCSANYLVGLEGKGQFQPRIPRDAKAISYLDSRSLIADNLIGNFSTCVYRTEALRTLPAALFDTRSYDWIMNIALARSGLIAFFHEVMSVYHIHPSGTWSGMSHRQKLQAQIDQIYEYDRLTARIFEAEWATLVLRLKAEVEHLRRIEEGGEALPPASALSPTELAATGQGAAGHSLMGRVIRRVYTALPKPVLQAARTISPKGLKSQIRKIGKS